MIVIAVLLIIFGGVNLAAGATEVGEIKFYSTYQTIQFPITDTGAIGGLGTTDIVLYSAITDIRANSERVGWGDSSVCFAAAVQSDGTCVITGTPNNDTRVQWSVKANGKTYWFNLDPASTKPWTLTNAISSAPQPKRLLENGANYFVEYGNYKNSTIAFDARTNKATVNFGCDLLVGLSKNGISSGDVKGVFFNDDVVGWFDKSTASGTISTGTDGNLQTVISNMPRSSQRGFFYFLLQNGDTWLNTGFGWKYEGANVSVSTTDGAIQYAMTPFKPNPAQAAINLLLD